MRITGIAAGLAVLMGARPASAADVICTLNGIERQVCVVHARHRPPVCQVRYVKPDEGGADRVLWYA